MNRVPPLLEAKNIKKYFSVIQRRLSRQPSSVLKAIDGVSLQLFPGETLGLIGESGCGKSTLARIIMNVIEPTEGEIIFQGQIINKENRGFRRKAQMVFQDPYSSLDPRMCVRRIVEEPLRVHTRLTRKQKLEKVVDIMEKVGMTPEDLRKFPNEFSGGQRQRIGIARAMILDPELLVLDEPVSALDVSIQASILNLLKEMQRKDNFSYFFISHDMSVIKHISDRIAVMYLGKIVELACREKLFANTLHPYSVALMNAIPIPDPMAKRKVLITGDPVSSINPPTGCAFQSRCPSVMSVCYKETPVLCEQTKDHYVACHLFK